MFGRQREAVEDFARTVELDDTHIDAWASIAKRVDVRQALEIYLRLTELAPDRPDWYAHVGIIYANAGDTRRAIEYYTHSLEADPDYSYSRRYRGQMYNRLGRYQDEVADHTYLIENVDDRNWVVRAYYDRASAYDNAGEHALAEADYRTSIQMGNRMPAAYSNLGWTYQQRSMWEDAIEAHPGKSGHATLAVMAGADDPFEAVDRLGLSDRQAEAAAFIGYWLYLIGQEEEGLVLLDEAVLYPVPFPLEGAFAQQMLERLDPASD